MTDLEHVEKQLSKWAKWSLLLVGIGWGAFILSFLIIMVFVTIFEIDENSLSGTLFLIPMFISASFISISMSIAIIGLIHIGWKPETRKGLGRCFGAMILSMPIPLCAFGMPALHSYKVRMSPYWDCESHQRSLYRDIKEYAEKNAGKYPPVEKWCDELLNGAFSHQKRFVCRGADPNCYELETNISHFAMNPNCEPNSAPDVVMLFDTKAGWNQCGEAELLAPENHNNNGCNILFNDGTVKFVKMKNFDKLKWK